MRRRFGNISTPARWLVGVLVAVLAIGTIVLVALALQSVRPEPVDEPLPEPTFTVQPRPTSTSSAAPSSTSTPQAADAAFARDQQRLLALGSEGWWRATTGSCGGTAPLVEHSVDGGETWEDVTPNYRGIAQVVTLDAFAGSEAQMVALMGTACETQALRTFTQGEFWAPYEDLLAASRYLDPADPASVVLPDGAVEAPCAVPTSFRSVGDIVALVCEGTASVLGDDAEWMNLAAPDAAAVTISDGSVFTAAVTPDCDGLAITRWSGTDFASSEPLGCAAGADPSAPLAFAAAGDDAALLWSGNALISVG